MLRQRLHLPEGVPPGGAIDLVGDGEFLHTVAIPANDSTAKLADVALPVDGTRAFRLADHESGFWVEARLLEAVPSTAQVTGEHVVYAAAFRGADVIHHVSREGTEDYVTFETAPAASELSYSVRLGPAVAGLRLFERQLEFLDRTGNPVLRVNAPEVVDAQGKRTPAELTLGRCAYDDSRRPPWGRPVVPPGAESCVLTVRWSRDVAYPAVVDPSWTTTGTASDNHDEGYGVGPVNGLVLFIGGHTATVEAYNPATGTFTAAPSLPAALSFTYANVNGFRLANGNIMVGQGNGYVFSPSSWSWSTPSGSVQSNTTIVPIQGGGAVGCGGYVTAPAGHGYLYDSSNNAWSETKSVWCNLDAQTYTYPVMGVGGTVPFFMGILGSPYTHGQVELYSTYQNKYYQGPVFSQDDTVQALALSDGRGMFFEENGSQLYQSPAYLTSSLNLGSWAAAPFTYSRTKIALAQIGKGTVIVVGGFHRDYNTGGTATVANVDLWSSSSNSWSSTTPLPTGLEMAVAAMASDGITIVTGGTTSNGSSFKSAYVLANPTTCSQNSDCLSGFCADGYCCNTACNGGSCDRCDLPGHQGICMTASAGDSGNPSCSPYLCDGSAVTCPSSCTSDANCDSSHYCSGGACIARLAKGTACTANNQCLTNSCADGFCCDSACTGGCQGCSIATGSTANGTCTTYAAGNAGAPSCTPFVCNGTSGNCLTTCASDADCVRGDYCDANGQCSPILPQGQACSRNSMCQSTFCADGYCCDTACTGACDRCDQPANPGTCGIAPQGTVPSPSCSNLVCDGTTSSCPSSCASDSQCVSTAYCHNSACVARQAQGTACAANDQCLSGVCASGFCCNQACSGSCQTCALAQGATANGQCTLLASGSVGSPSCAPLLCNGKVGTCPTSCASDADCTRANYCDSTSGTCVPKVNNGQQCARAAMCTSGFCVDGVCCNSGCGGACDSCNVSGKVGTCSPSPVGSAGSPTCAPYVCDGTSASCPTGCSSDAQCGAGYFCNGFSCVPVQNIGATCSRGSQCSSSFCASGVCCSTACNDGCDQCNLSGSVGTCHVSAKGFAGSPSCAPYICDGTQSICPASCTSDANCSSTGYCDGNNQCQSKKSNGGACTAAGQCLSGNCVDGVCCNSACNGACQYCTAALGATADGTCTDVAGAAGRPSCAPFVCTATSGSCPTSCTSSAQCQSGLYCKAGSCVPVLANGSACTGSDQCQSGSCADGFCCNSACSGSCDVCAASLGATANGTCTVVGGSGSPSCAPYICDGTHATCSTTCAQDSDCATGNYCDANQHCAPKGSPGAACTAGNQCLSTFCADGFCCNSACSGNCDVCAAALGASANGTCTDVAGYAGAPSCSPYLCSATSASCPAACTANPQCTSGNYCSGGACIPQVALGSSCTADAQCVSGHCADGVCCNSACTGSCDVCSAALGASANGTCTPVAGAGSPSCAPYLCNGTQASCPSTCANDAACAPGSYCGPGGTCIPLGQNGAACSSATHCQSGNCVDGVCCNTACAGNCDVCAAALGASADGTCTSVAGFAGAPSCSPYVCTSTSASCPTNCTADSQCAGNFYCSNGACVAKVANGNTCTASDQCQSGNCVDGFCCNSNCTGGCNACNLAGSEGTCTPRAQGTSGAAPSCAPYVCDGTHDACPTNCTADRDCAAGNYCGNGTCLPKGDLGATCSARNQCASNFCADGYCCDTICNGGCDACNIPGGEGTCSVVARGAAGSNPSCVPYVCDGQSPSCPGACVNDSGCAAGDFCNQGTCQPRYAPGQSCSSATQCASGFCADGVCCNSACTGGCNRCDLAASAGTCTPVAAGQPGSAPTCAPFVCDGTDGECPATCTADSACAPGNYCANGACVAALIKGHTCSADNQCASGICASGVCCETACDGACASCNLPSSPGMCAPLAAGTAPSDRTCGAFACNGTAEDCPTTCVSDSDCASGASCQAGTCALRHDNGTTCHAASECSSGNCVDGFCCDSACDGACQTCGASGHEGQCTTVSGQPVRDPSACGTDNTCAGTCDGQSAACTFPHAGVSCAPATCSEGTAHAQSTCDASGACAPGASMACEDGCYGTTCAKPSTSGPKKASSGGCQSSGDAPGIALALLLALAMARGLRRARM